VLAGEDKWQALIANWPGYVLTVDGQNRITSLNRNTHVIDASLMGAVGSRRDVALVFGSLAKKNWRAMLARLDHTASHHVFTAPQVGDVAEAVDPAEMAAAVGGEVVPDLREALARARTIVGSRGLVIVTGSTFLVGPARALLLGLESDPAIDL